MDKYCSGALLAAWKNDHTEASCKCLCERNPSCGGFILTSGSACGLVNACDSLTAYSYYNSYNNKPNAVSTECQEITILSPKTTTGSTTSTTGFPEITVSHPESTTKLAETTVGKQNAEINSLISENFTLEVVFERCIVMRMI